MKIKSYIFCALAVLVLSLTNCDDGDNIPVVCNDCDVDPPVVCESNDCDDDPPVVCEGDECGDDDPPVVCDDDPPIVCEGDDCDDDPTVVCNDCDDTPITECDEVYTSLFYVFSVEGGECGYLLFEDRGSAGLYHDAFALANDLPEEFRELHLRIVVTYCVTGFGCGGYPVINVVSITKNNEP